MQIFGKVTIFALVVLLSVMLPGCGTGRGHLGKNGGQDVPAERTEGSGARVEEAVRSYREGDLEASGEILREVLARDPMNPQALEYLGYLDKIVYCTVYPGDTVSEIAGYYYGNATMWPLLVRANGLSDPRRVAAYTRLRVPWFPSCDAGKDEMGRLQRNVFRGRETEKILLVHTAGDDTLESMARKHYGSERFGLFLADYNLLESRTGAPPAGTALRIPVLKKAPASSPRSAGAEAPKPPVTVCLQTVRDAMEAHEYGEACARLAEIPRASPVREEGDRLLARCRTDGALYYERSGDASLLASDPEAAGRYWEKALALDPANARLKKKLQETRDLMKTLEMLSEVR